VKRVGNLYDAIAGHDNLRLAFWKARRGKDGKPEVEAYRLNLVDELCELRVRLLAETCVIGNYHYFTIYDPKERLICAADFRERVLHHAIINVCEPVFERYQVFDSFACRRGKGLHACLERAKKHTRRYAWYLKLDVRKYFDSMPHVLLKGCLCRRFKDNRLLGLFDKIIDSYAVSPRHGIPIGNLASQYFANDYLAVMDHWLLEQVRVPGYIRYMDDFVIWHNEKKALNEIEREVRTFCLKQLGLELKPPCLNRTFTGVTMLGYRVFPDRVRLAARSRKRFADKLALFWHKLQKGEWGEDEFAAHVLPLTSYVRYAESAGFRNAIMKTIGCSP
jgi:RNA-directed DNA polymerase